jgi:hypothetical protein
VDINKGGAKLNIKIAGGIAMKVLRVYLLIILFIFAFNGSHKAQAQSSITVEVNELKEGVLEAFKKVYGEDVNVVTERNFNIDNRNVKIIASYSDKGKYKKPDELINKLGESEIQFKDVLANGDKIELLLKEKGSISVAKSSLERVVIYISDNQRNITAILFSTTDDVNNTFYYATWNNPDKSITISQFVFGGNQFIKKSEVIKHKALH